jgi:hypothetical protein
LSGIDVTQRRLYIIVPNFPPGEYAAARADNFRVWFLRNRSLLRNAYDLSVTDVELRAEGVHVLGSGATIQFSPPSAGPKVKNARWLAPRGTPKGLALRLALQVVLDEVDREGVALRNDTFIVQIDASGAFDFDSVYIILNALLDQEHPVDVVLGRRPGRERLMDSEDRVKVELFEEYLTETTLGRKSPDELEPLYADTQAGCWGLRCSALERLSLTAPAYELEFDLFCSTLMTGVSFGLSEELIAGTRIGPSGVSSTLPTGKRDHTVEVRKLPFIAHKLGLTSTAVRQAIDRYVIIGGELPVEYTEMVRRQYPSN